VAVDESTGVGAVDANARYGKGNGHPARLNMGGGFACAMARQHGVQLLSRGDDFARTDLA
jgi:ribonuclease VapC